MEEEVVRKGRHQAARHLIPDNLAQQKKGLRGKLRVLRRNAEGVSAAFGDFKSSKVLNSLVIK